MIRLAKDGGVTKSRKIIEVVRRLTFPVRVEPSPPFHVRQEKDVLEKGWHAAGR
jgi:hypothetical protein